MRVSLFQTPPSPHHRLILLAFGTRQGPSLCVVLSYMALASAAEKGMATQSSVLAWRIPGTGEPGGPPSMGSHRVGHDWSDFEAAAAAHKVASIMFVFNTVFPTHFVCLLFSGFFIVSHVQQSDLVMCIYIFFRLFSRLFSGYFNILNTVPCALLLSLSPLIFNLLLHVS